MALVIVEGNPGAGKTYDTCVRFMVPGVRKGRKIFTDIEGVDFFKLSELTGVSYEDVADLFTIIKNRGEWLSLLVHDADDKEGVKVQHLKRALFLIDEAQMVYPKEDAKDLRKFHDFLSYHRHLKADIVTMTQGAGLMDPHISTVCDRVYSIQNNGFISGLISNRYSIFVRQKPKQPNYTTITGTYDKKFFGIYKTTTDDGEAEAQLARPSAISGVLAVGLILAFACLGVRLYSHGLFSTPGGVKNVARNAAVGGVRAGVLDNQKAVAEVLRDSVADGAQRGDTPVSGFVGPRLMSAGESAVKGLDPKKTCYEIPVRSTWVIKVGKQPEERGWKYGSKTVCY